MDEEVRNTDDENEIPTSLRRKSQEPMKSVQVRIPMSSWRELSDLGREFDRDVCIFVREAIDDWLRRARKVRQTNHPID
jgi:hypothetical protein